MIYELRLWKAEYPKNRSKPDKVVRFTDYGAKGKVITHADEIARRGGFRYSQVLGIHFQGRGAKIDYGYGTGRDPIVVGSTSNPRRKKRRSKVRSRRRR